MSWDDFADAGWGKLVGLGMSLCHLDQVVAGLPVEERLLAAVVARLVTTAAGRRRHDELLAQHHYLHHASAVGQVLRYVAEDHGEWVAVLTFCSSAWHLKPRDRFLKWTARQAAPYTHL